MLNYLSLHPSTLGGVFWSIEKAIGLLFGGVAFNYHRAIDLAKFFLSFCVISEAKAKMRPISGLYPYQADFFQWAYDYYTCYTVQFYRCNQSN